MITFNFKKFLDDYKNLKEFKKYGEKVHYEFDSNADKIITTFLENRFISKIALDEYHLRLYSDELYLKLWVGNNGKNFFASSINLLNNWMDYSDFRLNRANIDNLIMDRDETGKLGYAESLFEAKDISISYKNLNLLWSYYDRIKNNKERVLKLKLEKEFEVVLNKIVNNK
jgi:hypothetical protein